mmetsp:Transcript_21836/g.53731  ORF Transcript_21836/g.53731 Transcript_21836/m.53731 type:complete len:484 (+) Transcript_21836:203-1654(+)
MLRLVLVFLFSCVQGSWFRSLLSRGRGEFRRAAANVEARAQQFPDFEIPTQQAWHYGTLEETTTEPPTTTAGPTTEAPSTFPPPETTPPPWGDLTYREYDGTTTTMGTPVPFGGSTTEGDYTTEAGATTTDASQTIATFTPAVGAAPLPYYISGAKLAGWTVTAGRVYPPTTTTMEPTGDPTTTKNMTGVKTTTVNPFMWQYTTTPTPEPTTPSFTPPPGWQFVPNLMSRLGFTPGPPPPNTTTINPLAEGKRFAIIKSAHWPRALSEKRGVNYETILSAKEQMHENQGGGPPPKPPKDCLRTPGLSRCSCVETIEACYTGLKKCMAVVDELQVEGAQLQKDSWMVKFDHPLLNTLQIEQEIHRLHGSFDPYEVGNIGERPPKKNVPQNLPQPSHFGHRLFQGGVDPSEFGAPGASSNTGDDEDDGPMAGMCPQSSMKALKDCQLFHTSCDRNVRRMSSWAAKTEALNNYYEANPGVFPGLDS